MKCPECNDPTSLGYVSANWNGFEYTDVGVTCFNCGYSDY